MSTTALAYLRNFWQNIEFARVNDVVARPEDILGIEHCLEGGRTERLPYQRLDQVPGALRSSVRVTYSRYYGFTRAGTFFHKDRYSQLDFDISLTCQASNWGNHTGCWEPPQARSLIAGEVEKTTKGNQFKYWFLCSPELKLLIDLVCGGNHLSEDELGRQLLTSSYPDMYWALARLVFFDNVQAFVDQKKSFERRQRHPAHGRLTGSAKSGGRLPVEHRGMWLPCSAHQYVHTLSCQLQEPNWWLEFERLARQQGVVYDHEPHSCHGCSIERRQEEDDLWP